jgi:hypothetical protein
MVPCISRVTRITRIAWIAGITRIASIWLIYPSKQSVARENGSEVFAINGYDICIPPRQPSNPVAIGVKHVASLTEGDPVPRGVK